MGFKQNWFKDWGWQVLIIVILVSGTGLSFYYGAVTCKPEEKDCGLYIRIGLYLLIANAIIPTIRLIYTSLQTRRERKENAIKELSELCDSAIREIFLSQYWDNIRANVMLRNKSDKLDIFAVYNSMSNLEKKVMKLNKGQGAAGVAWEYADSGDDRGWDPVFAIDITEENALKWDLKPKHLEVTKNLKWIIATPLKDPRSHKFVGVFNIDGDKKIQVPWEQTLKAKYADDSHGLVSMCVQFGNNILDELIRFRIR